MSTALALAILLQDPLHRSGTGNTPAIAAFREACVEGSLKLSPGRGKVLREREITDFVYMSDWGRPTRRRTVVKLGSGPSSYIVVAEYKNLQPRSIARTCALISGDISKEEAAAAYLENLPDKVVAPMRWPPQWTSDHPELGYMKRLRLRSDGSIVLEVGMYPAAAARMNAGTTKQ